MLVLESPVGGYERVSDNGSVSDTYGIVRNL